MSAPLLAVAADVALPAGKLVRDKIPAIIRATGAEPVVRTAEPAEYASLLRDKLTEEAGEFLDSGDPAELADILEVVYALTVDAGMTPRELRSMCAAKARERGRFDKRVVWHGNRAGAG